MNEISDAYIYYAERKFQFYEKKCEEFFNRNIRQILLIHANRLNADHFCELSNLIKQLGYKFISLDMAIQDSAYTSTDTYTGNRGLTWIQRWAITSGREEDYCKGEPFLPDYFMKFN
jgi:hypothetical protein